MAALPEIRQALGLADVLDRDFLTPEFPHLKIPHGHCLSVWCVFEPYDYDSIIALRLNDRQDLPNLKKGGSLVLLHQAAGTPCPAPEGTPPEIPMQAMRLAPVPDGDDEARAEGHFAGDLASKVGGIAGWAQEAITLEGMRYVMQLDDSFLPKNKKKNLHEGIFSHETAFLMLNEKLAPGQAGVFILQTA